MVALPSITASLYLAAATRCSSLSYERTGSNDKFSSWVSNSDIEGENKYTTIPNTSLFFTILLSKGQDYAKALVKRNIYFDSGASAICRIITYMVEILSALHKKNDDQVSLNCILSIKFC